MPTWHPIYLPILGEMLLGLLNKVMPGRTREDPTLIWKPSFILALDWGKLGIMNLAIIL